VDELHISNLITCM